MGVLEAAIEYKDLVIIGAGGIGRETAYIIEEINKVNKKWNIIGFIDDNSDMWGECLNGYNVLGGTDYLKKMKSKPYIVVALANCQMKRNIVENLKDEFEFATIIHPSIKISKYTNIGQGSIIYEGAVITINSTIGNHVIISGNCGIGHDTVIGDYSTLLWGVNLCGYDILGEEVFIGIGVNIVKSLKIHDGIEVNAGITIVENM